MIKEYSFKSYTWLKELTFKIFNFSTNVDYNYCRVIDAVTGILDVDLHHMRYQAINSKIKSLLRSQHKFVALDDSILLK